MSIPQELRSVRDTLILANMEADSIVDLLKNPTSENVEKAMLKMNKLKEQLQKCI